MDRKIFSIQRIMVPLIVVFSLSVPSRPTQAAAPALPEVSRTASIYREAPMLYAMVKGGALPPLDRRLPRNPMLIQPDERIGAYGGIWHLAMVKGDFNTITRHLQYEGLVRWDPNWTKVIPNVAQSFEASADSREFTFHLRQGMRWSDGAPFTADDIMFWYQDIYLKPELKPTHFIFLNGMEQHFTVVKPDDYTVIFRFDKPFGLFLQQMATMSGAMMTLYPKHYLQQFHPDYNPDIGALITQEGVKDWVELFNTHRDGSVTSIHPGTPALFAWIFDADTPLGETPGDTFQAVRNPYYWKIDTGFKQLPYIDRVEFTVVETREAATALAIAGKIEMQNRNILTAAYTPDNLKHGRYGTFQLENTDSNAFVISFNQTTDDPIKRTIFQNRDFRIGLSYAINRPALIAAIAQNVKPFQAAPTKGSPFYNEQMATQFTEYNVDLANHFLDRTGYRRRDVDGFRLGPDGQRIRFTLIVPAPYLAVSNVEFYCSHIQADWRAVGVEMQVETKPRLEV